MLKMATFSQKWSFWPILDLFWGAFQVEIRVFSRVFDIYAKSRFSSFFDQNDVNNEKNMSIFSSLRSPYYEKT